MASNDESASDAKKKLIINYLPQNLTDQELHDLFANIGTLESCRIMKDYKTGYSFGYGFVTYVNEDDADRAIGTLNGYNVGGKRLKVSYARPPGEAIRDTNLYVVNLPKNFQDQDLDDTFGPFGNIVQKNLLKDKITGMPRGVAFVRYDKKEEAQAAIAALNGTQLGGSLLPLQVRLAEEHGKQKAAYFAGLQTGIALKHRMPSLPPGPFPQANARGRGNNRRFNPMGRGGFHPSPGFFPM